MKKKYIHRKILIFLVTISITTGQDSWSKPDNKGLETDWIPVKGKCLSCKPSTDLQPEASDDQIKKVLSPPFPQTNFLFPPPNPSQYQFKQPRLIEQTPNIQFIPQYSQDNKYYQKLQPLFFQFGANQLNPHKFVFDSYKPVHNAPQQFLLPQVGYPYLQPQLLKTQEPLKSDGKWRFDTNIPLNGGNQQYHKIRFPDSNITVKNPQPIAKPEIQEVQLLYVPVETLMHQKGRALKNMKINIDKPSLPPFTPYQQPQLTHSGNPFPSEVIRQETTALPTFESHYNPQRPNDYFPQPLNSYISNPPSEVVRQVNNFPSTTAPSIETSYTQQNHNHFTSQPPNAYIGNTAGGISGQRDTVQPTNQPNFESYVNPQKSFEYFSSPSPNPYSEVVGNAANSGAVRNIENQINQQPTFPPAYQSYLLPQNTKEYFPGNKYPDNSVIGAVNSETQVGQESTTPRIYESHYNSHVPDNYFPQPPNSYLTNSVPVAQEEQVKQESTTQQIHTLNSIKTEHFTQQQHYFPSSPSSQYNTPELQKNTESLSYENLHPSTTQKDTTTTSPLPASTTPQSQTTSYFGTYYSVQQGSIENKSPELIPSSASERAPQVTSSSVVDQRFAYSEPFSQYPEQTPTYPVPHQPPLSVYMERLQNSKLNDILNVLKYSKTVPVLDYIDENSPQVFVGPSELQAPKGYVKFDLPYLSSLDSNRIERMIDRLPFFVAPLNFKPPTGYSKIPFPAPHIGSVVVSNTTTFKDIHDKLQQKYVPTYQQSIIITTTTPEVPSSTMTEPPSTRNPTRYQTSTTKKYRQRRPIHRGFPSTTERTTQTSDIYRDSTTKPDESAYIIPVTNIPEANSSSNQGFPNEFGQVSTSVKQHSNEFIRLSPASQQYTNDLNRVTIPVQQYPNEFSHQTTTTSQPNTEFNQQSTHSQQYLNEYNQFSSPSQQYPNDPEHISTPIQPYSTILGQNPTVSEQHTGEINEKLFPSQQYSSELNQLPTQSTQYSDDLSHISSPDQHYSIGYNEKTIIGQESNIQNTSNFQNIKPLSQFMTSDQASENPTYKNEMAWSPNPDYYTLPVTAGYQNFLDQTKSDSSTTEVDKSTTVQNETTTRSSEILRVRAKQRVSPSRYHYPRNQYTAESTEATTTAEHESTRPNRRRRPIRPQTSTETRTYRGRSTKQPTYLRRRTTTTEQNTYSSTTENYGIPSSNEKNNHDSEAFWNEPVTVYHSGIISSNLDVYNITSPGHDVLSSTSDIASNDESQPTEKDKSHVPNEASQLFDANQEIPKSDKINITESANISGSDVENPSWELSKERLLLKQDTDSQKKAYDYQDKKVTPGRRRGTWVRKIRLKKPQDVFETAESQNLAHLTNNDIKTETKSTTESLSQDISLHTDFTDMLTQLLSDKNEEVNTTTDKEVLKEENNEKDNETIIDDGYSVENTGSTSDNQKGDENPTDIDNKNTETETEKIGTEEKEEKSTEVPEASLNSTITATDDVRVENGIKNVREQAEDVEKEEEKEDTSSNIIATSTTTEISLETEICYKGKCVKSKKTKASDLLPVE